MDWKQKRVDAGWQTKLVWLRPEAVEALAGLKALFPGDSEGDILSRAAVYLAEHADEHRTTAAPTIDMRLRALEETVRELRTGQGTRTKGPGAGSVQRKGGGKRISHWQADLVEFTARRMFREGSDFNTNQCWRLMQEEGIDAHAQGSGFYTWLSKPHNRAEVEDRVRELAKEERAKQARLVAEDEAKGK